MIERTNDPQRRAGYEAELALPPFPEALAYLWQAFQRLARRRASSGFGPNPISWSDIDAFARHGGLRLAPWEIEIIERLDDLQLAEIARARAAMQSEGGG